ncbi:transcriptional regulator [Enterococcus sp. JM4C]|uniref:MerR family transcriptional regulator n=1 Tax=Candidatus Enterococcus huntleyi TaxID=1857217 RepID=UPI0013797AD3|nr:MerR family transcriptional regulator [Enterococcus sp. JM4C]KAF1296743.1 transcriptional regulator [Enterococcus sp. JM4C]
MNISEAAKIYDMTPATLRYYEKEGLIPPVTRNKAGIRDYQEEDLSWIDFIKCMRDSGLSIDSLAKYSALYQEGDETLAARKDILVDEYQKLLEKQAMMDKTVKKLETKLAMYDKQIKQVKEVMSV